MRLSAIAIACMLGLSANVSAADVKSISRLAAGPADILFVADWKAAEVHAIKLAPASRQPTGGVFNVLDLEKLLSDQVGGARVAVEDMVARPGTGEVYVAVSYGADKTPALFVVTSDKKARRVDLKAAQGTSVALRDAPTTNEKFWKEMPERSFTVTDMKWHDGELFVAGLSNQDFASTLRRIRYPFDAKQSITSVEIFHGGHNLIETRAPIRAMSFAKLGGQPYLVAAYTCTPLVIIPLDELKDGAHIRGKTVGELGYGNTPADMVSYSQAEQGKTRDFLMLVNYNRVSNIIPVSELDAARAGPGIDKQVPFGQIAGLNVAQAPLAGVMRLDNLDDKSFIVVRRDLQHDELQLVSMGKDLSFRLSDHISEYAFPNFSFKGNAFQEKYIKPRQDMLLKDEGFPELIKASD
ncbi:hypothetical protein ABZR86_14140 [Dyella marensis]|uniref:Uncharacterized protein n=1 Tax=Dyella marensis TaxID=500610 RepID=A0A1I2J9E4_9GAMM|nr:MULTISPECIES: hypothetical protein [Dyella]SFF50939.1 hypothetical protein SAMN02799615_03903 [Dyella marensis]